jgi:hypothetical protein
MNDIWSKVGSEFSPQGEDWLYQKGGQIHGPVPKETIVQKLLGGEMGVDTQVAREGGDFHPISQVATFAPHLEEVKKILRKRSSAKLKKALAGVLVLLLAAGGAGFWYLQKEAARKKKENFAKEEKDLARLEERKKKAEDLIEGDKVELVALVSFDEKQMTVGNTKPSGSSGRKPSGGRPSGGKDPGGGKPAPEEAPGRDLRRPEEEPREDQLLRRRREEARRQEPPAADVEAQLRRHADRQGHRLPGPRPPLPHRSDEELHAEVVQPHSLQADRRLQLPGRHPDQDRGLSAGV